MSLKYIASKYNQLLDNDEDKDITFSFENSNQIIKAHKLIIRAVSPVFNAMFSGAFVEKDTVIIHDIRPEIFMMLIKVMYLYEIKIENMDDAVDLYHAADMYEINDLKELSTKYMIKNCNVENCLFLYSMASIFKLKEVLLCCEEQFIQNNKNILISTLFQKEEVTEDTFIAVAQYWTEPAGALYLLLETYVETGKIKTYKNMLSVIQFLFMSTEEIIAARLLTDEEKFAILSNIEAQKNNREPWIPLPKYISLHKYAKPKLISYLYSHIIWIACLLGSPTKEYTSFVFKKMMSFELRSGSERSAYNQIFEGLLEGKRMIRVEFELLNQLFKKYGKDYIVIICDDNSAKICVEKRFGNHKKLQKLICYEYEDKN